MSTPAIRAVLAVLAGARGRETAVQRGEIVRRVPCSELEALRALRLMLDREPAWVAGDVNDRDETIWWLTPAGRDALAS